MTGEGIRKHTKWDLKCVQLFKICAEMTPTISNKGHFVLINFIGEIHQQNIKY